MKGIAVALLTALVAAVGAGGASAAPAAYRWVDDDGVVNYSDRAPQPRAASPTRHSREAIDELLSLSGLRRQAVAITARIRAEFHQQHGRLTPQDLERAERITAARMRTDAVYGLIADGVGKRADAAKMAAALAWFRSSPGRRITEREVAFSRSGDVEQEIARYVGRLEGSPPGRERVALLQRLDAAGRASETSLDVSLAVVRSLASTLEPHLPAERRLGPRQLESRLRAAREEALGQVRRLSFLAMLFVYRDVSDGDLEAYARFAESEAGQWYVDAVSGAFVDAVAVVVRGAAAELLQAVPPRRWLQAGETRL
ncbi:MAG: hypothetical protein A3F92_02335 [Candidatus Rokubacteria bacterium RIFCSPLOWO2_12_FULL_71_22]|nr:MAG: hypothetical protein A3I17_07880 [Candidatus Rokubacteria bacterium RIFCSPLOWO2_02_FULL_72_37]OGL18814.1 MAG: hypothetical protein A3F92_02335 [Candidatus Rokubacteria bacterium RIFCSPLOWO2_12_FULL_71_22]